MRTWDPLPELFGKDGPKGTHPWLLRKQLATPQGEGCPLPDDSDDEGESGGGEAKRENNNNKRSSCSSPREAVRQGHRLKPRNTMTSFPGPSSTNPMDLPHSRPEPCGPCLPLPAPACPCLPLPALAGYGLQATGHERRDRCLTYAAPNPPWRRAS